MTLREIQNTYRSSEARAYFKDEVYKAYGFVTPELHRNSLKKKKIKIRIDH